MRTASSGMRPLEKRCGTSDRKTGTYSARPSLTASRAFGPMNRARWRKWPAISGARCGPGPSMWRWTTLTSLELGRAGDERIEQERWRGRRALDVELVARPDAGDRFGRADDAHGPSLRVASRRPTGPNRPPTGGERPAVVSTDVRAGPA